MCRVVFQTDARFLEEEVFFMLKVQGPAEKPDDFQVKIK
jgi:hypothetical protein